MIVVQTLASLNESPVLPVNMGFWTFVKWKSCNTRARRLETMLTVTFGDC